MKVWITKYALSSGIFQVEAKVSSQDSMVVDSSARYPRYYHGEGKEWHLTKESSIAKAEDMRTKKIASLKKQIAKLEKLSFS